ncbi:flagellar hook-associated protein FlgK [Roseateles sp. BYS180W]|uniref:Flagellar hook-associated protein 1 n=1 Tax=Roseateles rivi TaxID=3299028 RepID=A0ABW7FUZ6_9BURK
MSTSGLLSLGMRSMFASQAALQAVGQNIANANTPGYSRQQVVLTTPEGQYTGAGFFGKGVMVQTVTRAHNEFLTREAVGAKSKAFMDSTALNQLQQLEKLFPTGEQGMGQAVNQFLNAMVDVASRPADPSARQVALGRAYELAARFQSAGQQFADLQAGVVSDMDADVKVVNQLAQQIAEANNEIARTAGDSHTPNDLLDRRDQLISELSQYVQVSTVPNGNDGTVGVFIGGGQRLVLGGIAQQLAVIADPYDSSRAQLAMKEAGGNLVLDQSVLTGGSLAAMLQFQNVDLNDGRNMMGQLALALAQRVNDQQSLGLDLNAQQGAALFALADPQARPAATNTGGADFKVSVLPGAASRVPASSLLVQADPDQLPDRYRVTIQPNGSTELLTREDIEKRWGLSFNLQGSMAPGDSYRVEPVANAAASFRRVLDNPVGLAAASPLTAILDSKNRGTATLDSVYAVNSQFDPSNQPISLQFGAVDNLTKTIAYTLTLSDGTIYNGSWKSGATIGNDPQNGIDLGFELRLNGMPRGEEIDPSTGIVKPGDIIVLQRSNAAVSSNNGNAKAFLNLQREPIVGRVLQPDGSLSRGQTMTEAYGTAMANIGARVQGAGYLSEVSTGVAADAEATRAGFAGVNLDEEAAKLMQFQQSYQAAAKVMQTAQAVFQELLSIMQR